MPNVRLGNGFITDQQELSEREQALRALQAKWPNLFLNLVRICRTPLDELCIVSPLASNALFERGFLGANYTMGNREVDPSSAKDLDRAIIKCAVKGDRTPFQFGVVTTSSKARTSRRSKSAAAASAVTTGEDVQATSA